MKNKNEKKEEVSKEKAEKTEKRGKKRKQEVEVNRKKDIFPWKVIKEANKMIDDNIYYIGCSYLLEIYKDECKSCEFCKKEPKDLDWVFISYNQIEGDLLYCSSCKNQIKFFPDEEFY